ncbi:hypothetical protein GE09DRAFT_1232254 [Coniochaeta sp. 2T2.1]|nr:hypothetical protein GE09DRAFT_1232254 [Coniochaeta sp. 2T2.1]
MDVSTLANLHDTDTLLTLTDKDTLLTVTLTDMDAHLTSTLTKRDAMTYVLDNSDTWFDEATLLPATRLWLDQAFDRGQDVYVVVGFHTVTNARVMQESLAGGSAGGQITVPVGLSLAAAGAIVPFGSALDPSAAVYQQGSDGTQPQFVAPGEHICAVQYRKICHQWLSSKHIDKAGLSVDPRWKFRLRKAAAGTT